MPVTRKKRVGFTLVELLVVIAVIAVLVAILMPVISGVQEKARQARCLANMIQINTALRAYKADYGHYPPNPWFDSNSWSYQGGPNCLYPDYLSNKANLRCPNDLRDMRGVPENVIPVNYCSYSGQIAGGNDPSQWSYWAFASFADPDNGLTRFKVTYNYGGFDNDGWDETCFVNPGWTFKYPPGGAVPPWLAAEGKKWRHYPRLGNDRAPDNTVTMHCIHHRNWYGSNQAKWRDPVVRLGGEAETVAYQPWAQPVQYQNVWASQWKVQK